MTQPLRTIRVLHHNDLDGLAAGAIIHMAHVGDHVHSSAHTYGDINEALKKAFTETVRPYDRIVVADISWQAPDPAANLSAANRQMIEQDLPDAIREFRERGGELVLLDHHPAALSTKAYYGRYVHQESIVETKDITGVPRAGSELAARYMHNLRQYQAAPHLLEAVKEFGRVCGVYDTWRKNDKDWKVGCLLAMAQSELLNDPQTCLMDMLTAIKHMEYDPTLHRDGYWTLIFAGTVFGRYLLKAPVRFEEAVAEAKRGAIQHGEHITEIFCTHFESLVSERIYEGTGGVVAIRYTNERHLAKKLSFRKGSKLPVDLGAVLKPLAEKAGGHPFSAGIALDYGQTIDDVIHAVNKACEKSYQPSGAA